MIPADPTTDALVEMLTPLAAPMAPPAACELAADWWPGWLTITAQHAAPAARAIIGGALADRAAWVFAAGYQAAVRALLRGQPDVVPPTAMSAFCVTEETGNRPADIKCRLEPTPSGYRLFGAKRWATLGPASNVLLVAARLPPHDAARPQLRMVRVSTDAPGVTITMMPPTRFIPEVPHARLTFDGVELASTDVLPGDGYEHYVKPFRTLEDIHLTVAVLAYLLAEAGRRQWPAGWRERALFSLLGFETLSRLDPAAPLTHLMLTGALAGSDRLIEEAHPLWALTPDEPTSQRWVRDASLFGVASGVRKQRALRAWERLAAG